MMFSLWSTATLAERISDISNTRHNFSAEVTPTLPGGATRNAVATSESQICAFCHTPHGATVEPKAPLWNRSLSTATYTPYTSGSLDAIDLGQPGGKSKLCLSCHDGTLAIGAVNVLNRIQNPNISVGGPGIGPGGTIPEGLGPTTGFTRRLGVDLTNDHPISFTFDQSQFTRDGELQNPATSPYVQTRVAGTNTRPLIPLEDNKVECVSCHDPHIRDSDPNVNRKFLRVNRFQANAQPTDDTFEPDNDIICWACHDKAGWVGSAHANPLVGNKPYATEAAALREFPADIEVWQAACLNCHDPHTVEGARRILREGTDGPQLVDATTGGKYKQGGNSAIEETCYACHSSDGGTLQNQGTVNFEVPNIKTDFTTMARHMPITSSDQPAGIEVHNIGSSTPNPQNTTLGGSIPQAGKDFIEGQEVLGKGNLTNRHAECTDCHNPHRVAKTRLFNGDNLIPDTEGTHPHTETQIVAAGEATHTNIASGVLRGIWGVEPTAWSSTEFGSLPTSFDLKRGDPGTGASTNVNSSYVTREYQVCLKCHSNYGYDTPPTLGSFTGGTPPGSQSGLNATSYTNQGMEYQSPIAHQGEGTATGSGSFPGIGGCSVTLGPGWVAQPAPQELLTINGNTDNDGNCSDWVTDNHRAWHPVIRETGRTSAVRAGADPDLWRTPFNIAGAMGVQTMYCTDCHGSQTTGLDETAQTPNGGEQGSPWGPHGSNSNFLLKGDFTLNTRGQTGTFGGGVTDAGTPDGLCFKCHRFEAYGEVTFNNPGGVTQSGFRKNAAGQGGCLQYREINLHSGHLQQVQNFRCTYCHIAVPHGWKNKNFLVNLNDVGSEASLLAGEPEGSGTATSRQVRNNPGAGLPTGPGIINGDGRYYNGLYYNGAVLKVREFARSGEWIDVNCGSAGAPGDGRVGRTWMLGAGGETCSNLP